MNGSRAIWDWEKAGSGDAGAGPNLARTGLRRALWQACVAAMVAGVLLAVGRRLLAQVALALAAAGLATALLAPAVYVRVEKALGRFGRALGVFVTVLMLAPFFYLCFVPARLILLIAGRDPLERKFPGNEPSYWKKRACRSDLRRYIRQY